MIRLKRGHQGAWEAYEEGGLAALGKYGLEEATINLLMSSSVKMIGKTINKARAAVKESLTKGGEGAAERVAKDMNCPATEAKASAKDTDLNVKWVDENAQMNPKAKAYNDSAEGARSNISTKKGQAPTLEYTKDSGKIGDVRFDGIDGDVLIDRKIAIVTTDKSKNQALRQSEALKQNSMRAQWEVPDASQLRRAQKMLDDLNIKNIDVRIVK